MSEKPSRVLVIAHAFPPCGGAGVQRTAKFVKYLPQFGWTPTVLTVLPSCYGLLDPSLERDLPEDVEIVRTSLFDPVARSSAESADYSALEPLGKSKRKNGRKRTAAFPIYRRLLRPAMRWSWIIVDNLLLIPDHHILWFPHALKAGLRLLRRKKFQLIYATGEPYSSYMIALWLSRLTGVPFVLDMRDPWTLAPYRIVRHVPFRHIVERRQERRVLVAAKACIFAITTALYKDAYPDLQRKFHYIPNGYDSADFEGVAPKRFDNFTVVHSGTFLPGYRTAETFLQALRQLVTTRPDIVNQLQVLFVGRPGQEEKLTEKLSLRGIVKHIGYVPHSESIGYLKGADLLLLIGGRHSWEESGKVYEYIAAGKPILALVEPAGSAATLLQSIPWARVIRRESIDDTRSALANAVRNGRYHGPVADSAVTTRFERKELTRRLAKVFTNCL